MQRRERALGLLRHAPLGADQRVFPVADSDLLPVWLAPFVGVEVGGIFVEDIDPFVAAAATVGANFYLTRNVAITPEVGYGVTYATDDRVRFGGERVEHAVAATWNLSVFF